MINADVNVKNQLIGVLVKITICKILVHVIVSVIKHELKDGKTSNYQWFDESKYGIN